VRLRTGYRCQELVSTILFDLWVEAWRRKVASGDMVFVRYADDLVVGFEQREDAERFLRGFRKRLGDFALKLHPEKTRLIEFGRFAQVNVGRQDAGTTETILASSLIPQLPKGSIPTA
jgi:RNA-directed DNA polymerase